MRVRGSDVRELFDVHQRTRMELADGGEVRVAGAHAAEIVAEGEAEFVHRLAGEQLAEEGVEGVARGRGCGGDGEEVHDERIRARRHLKDADGRARAGFPLAVEADDGG